MRLGVPSHSEVWFSKSYLMERPRNMFLHLVPFCQLHTPQNLIYMHISLFTMQYFIPIQYIYLTTKLIFHTHQHDITDSALLAPQPSVYKTTRAHHAQQLNRKMTSFATFRPSILTFYHTPFQINTNTFYIYNSIFAVLLMEFITGMYTFRQNLLHSIRFS